MSRSASLRAARLAALALVVAGWAPGVRAAKSIRLQHGLQAGATYDLTSRLNITVAANLEGAGEILGDDTPLNFDVEQDLTMRSFLRVGGPAADRTLPVDCRIDSLEGRVVVGGQEFPLPGLPEEARSAAGFRGKLLADRLEVAAELTGVDSLPPDTRQMLSQVLQNLPKLPKKKLKIGESFQVPVRLELPGLPTGGDLETSGSITFTLRSVDSSQALFDTRAELSARATESGDGALDTRITGTLVGTAVFDRGEGIFSSQQAELAMEMTMDMEIPADAPADGGVAQPPGVAKIRATATGPVEIGMVRRRD